MISLRGTLYVMGGASAYVAANIYAPHEVRGWVGFYAGLIGNSCILWRAFLDQSHTKFSADKPITELEPASIEHTEATVSTTVETTKTTS